MSGPKYLDHHSYPTYSYLVHSSFTLIFPLHLLCLLATTKYTVISLFNGLRTAIINHLCTDQRFTTVSLKFPYYKFFRLVFILTVGITIPALLWFAAISLASSVISPLCIPSILIRLILISFQSKRCIRRVLSKSSRSLSELNFSYLEYQRFLRVPD